MRTIPVRSIQILTIVFSLCVLFGCASLEKRVDLTYQAQGAGKTGSGEVVVARPLMEVTFPVMPGRRAVLGSISDSGTQLVTTGSIPDWVMKALSEELTAVGYTVVPAASLPARVARGVLVKVQKLSVGQETDGLVFTTSTEIALAAEVWKNGRLGKTVTASAANKDQGLDRSGDVVTASLQKTLRLTMEELVPGIANSLEE